MSHETQTSQPTTRCEHDDCSKLPKQLVALIDGPSFKLCHVHAEQLLDSVAPDEIADVVPLSGHVDNVQTLHCVGYELHVQRVTISGETVCYRVQPSYARVPLVEFDTYREAMTFAVERNVDEFETEMSL